MLGMMEARPQAGALDGVAGESEKQVLAHMTLPLPSHTEPVLTSMPESEEGAVGGPQLFTPSFWDGPKGLGYHHPLPSASFPAPLRHCSPVFFPHLSLGRQGENWDAWIFGFIY